MSLLSLSLSLRTIVEGGRYREAAKRAADREGTAPRVDGKRNAVEESCRRRESERHKEGVQRGASPSRKRKNGYRRAEPVCASASESD